MMPTKQLAGGAYQKNKIPNELLYNVNTQVYYLEV